jgi:anaerobic ribonucleoside-triphosphate reductase activating protein
MKNIGKTLNKKTLSELLERYCETATCICFMGGDAKPDEVERLAEFLQKKTNGKIKTGWYSGKDNLPQNCSLQNFNYIKLGAYKQHLGGLSVPTTNQRFYRIEHGNMLDQTYLFWQKAAVI